MLTSYRYCNWENRFNAIEDLFSAKDGYWLSYFYFLFLDDINEFDETGFITT